MKRGYSVTNTQQAVDKAGVSDEYAYQMLKAMKDDADDGHGWIQDGGSQVRGYSGPRHNEQDRRGRVHHDEGHLRRAAEGMGGRRFAG